MPRLRTDDGPRKLRAVWLGPAGHTLPFQWTYVQWAVTLIAVPVAGTIGTAIVYALLGDPVWAFGLGGLWFGAGGVYLAIHLMRNVTFDEPLSYQRRLVKGGVLPPVLATGRRTPLDRRVRAAVHRLPGGADPPRHGLGHHRPTTAGRHVASEPGRGDVGQPVRHHSDNRAGGSPDVRAPTVIRPKSKHMAAPLSPRPNPYTTSART